MKVTRKTTITIELDEEYAGKLARSIGRLTDATRRNITGQAYEQLVNTSTFDQLLALKLAIFNALPEDSDS